MLTSEQKLKDDQERLDEQFQHLSHEELAAELIISGGNQTSSGKSQRKKDKDQVFDVYHQNYKTTADYKLDENIRGRPSPI